MSVKTDPAGVGCGGGSHPETVRLQRQPLCWPRRGQQGGVLPAIQREASQVPDFLFPPIPLLAVHQNEENAATLPLSRTVCIGDTTRFAAEVHVRRCFRL